MYFNWWAILLVSVDDWYFERGTLAIICYLSVIFKCAGISNAIDLADRLLPSFSSLRCKPSHLKIEIAME